MRRSSPISGTSLMSAFAGSRPCSVRKEASHALSSLLSADSLTRTQARDGQEAVEKVGGTRGASVEV